MTQAAAAARPDASILDASVVIVSFNTREVLRECLSTLAREAEGLSIETFVVDNVSGDGSAAMVEQDFPWVQLRRSGANLGFAGANNVAFREARGRYVVLLNSDAFLEPGALRLSIEKMDLTPRCGLAGARLVGRDGAWQPAGVPVRAERFSDAERPLRALSDVALFWKNGSHLGKSGRGC